MLNVYRNPIRPDVLYFAEEKCVCFGHSIRPDVMYFAGETCKLNGPLRGGASLSRHATRPAGAAPGAGSKEGDHPTIDIYIASDRFRVQLLTVGLARARPKNGDQNVSSWEPKAQWFSSLNSCNRGLCYPLSFAAVGTLEDQLKRLEQRLAALEVSSGSGGSAAPTAEVCVLIACLGSTPVNPEFFVGMKFSYSY